MLGRDGLHLAFQQADVHFAPLVLRADTDPLERLAGRLEIRAQAEIDPDAMVLRSLRAAERESGRDAFYGAWRDRSAPLADLAGKSALAGMAAALFARLGARGADRPLLDALLNLAPMLIQCVPAVMERWQSRPGAPRPGMMAGGGMVDSCYMWRRGGALHQRMVGDLAAIRVGGDGRLNPSRAYSNYVLAVLTTSYVVNYLDRYVLSMLAGPVKQEFGISDATMGMLLGPAFALFYSSLAVPVAWLADRYSRRGLISAGMVVVERVHRGHGPRAVVAPRCDRAHRRGVGESAGAAPAQSLIVDYFPPERRATALSILQMGVTIGQMLGMLIGGLLVAPLGWRNVFFVGRPARHRDRAACCASRCESRCAPFPRRAPPRSATSSRRSRTASACSRAFPPSSRSRSEA